MLLHDDPKFIEAAAAALRLAGHQVAMFVQPLDALNALETEHFEISDHPRAVPHRAAQWCGVGADGPNKTALDQGGIHSFG
jgi:hypothetical protein